MGMQKSGLSSKKHHSGRLTAQPSNGLGTMQVPPTHFLGISKHRLSARVSHLTSSSETLMVPLLVSSMVPPCRCASMSKSAESGPRFFVSAHEKWNPLMTASKIFAKVFSEIAAVRSKTPVRVLGRMVLVMVPPPPPPPPPPPLVL